MKHSAFFRMYILLSVFCMQTVFVYSNERKVDIHKSIPDFINKECPDLVKTEKLVSAYPVRIKIKGSSLLVISNDTQMLPIYKASGMFYGLFKLNKGNNWINGFPKGRYIINNQKITIS